MNYGEVGRLDRTQDLLLSCGLRESNLSQLAQFKMEKAKIRMSGIIRVKGPWLNVHHGLGKPNLQPTYESSSARVILRASRRTPLKFSLGFPAGSLDLLG